MLCTHFCVSKPKPKRGEHIRFGADHVGVRVHVGVRIHVHVASFPYSILDFDQSCMVTLLGGGKSELDLVDHHRICKVTKACQMSNFDQNVLNGMIDLANYQILNQATVIIPRSKIPIFVFVFI